MRLLIAAVGRLRAGPERDLVEAYRRRLAWPVAIKEVAERRKLPPSALREREGELLLAVLPSRAAGLLVVVLDGGGKTLSSATFATAIAKWRDAGKSDIAFLIGGPDGHAEAVRRRADFVLSLGAMTWPHLLARVMLLEQLYRAQQILAGHPYHRG